MLTRTSPIPQRKTTKALHPERCPRDANPSCSKGRTLLSSTDSERLRICPAPVQRTLDRRRRLCGSERSRRRRVGDHRDGRSDSRAMCARELLRDFDAGVAGMVLWAAASQVRQRRSEMQLGMSGLGRLGASMVADCSGAVSSASPMPGGQRQSPMCAKTAPRHGVAAGVGFAAGAKHQDARGGGAAGPRRAREASKPAACEPNGGHDRPRRSASMIPARAWGRSAPTFA